METQDEYRIVCDCHGPIASGLTKSQATEQVGLFQQDDTVRNAHIERRVVTYTEWQPVDG